VDFYRGAIDSWERFLGDMEAERGGEEGAEGQGESCRVMSA
jgi:hypothetical protein